MENEPSIEQIQAKYNERRGQGDTHHEAVKFVDWIFPPYAIVKWLLHIMDQKYEDN